MSATTKRYTTSYKKKVDTERDPYLPKQTPQGTLQCAGCGIFYYRRHWMLAAPSGFNSPVHFHRIYCPACRKVKDRYPSGELLLLQVAPRDRGEVLRILRNEERRAREKNPLGRIMRLESNNGEWKIETTTEKLAQRLGRALRDARGGGLEYKWSHNNKFVRVLWENKAS